MKYIILIPLLLASTLFAKEKQSSFSLLDTDEDNKISLKEIHDFKVRKDIKLMKKQVETTFKRCDKNGDGKISKEEVSMADDDKKTDFNCKLPAIVLDTMDENQDGFLDKKEALNNIRPSTSQRSKIAKRMREKLKQREEKIRAKYIVKRFEICDGDKDDQLSLREATSRICGYDSDTFDELDKNMDEFLSFDEMNVKRDQKKLLQKELNSKKFQNADPLRKFTMAFYLCDSDDDSLLSKNEAFHADCNVESAIFKKYDFNKDGFIDRDENSMVRESKFFKKFDKNEDGFLDKEEFSKSYYRKFKL